MRKYRIFVNDIGPNQFSALKDVTEISAATALLKFGCWTEVRRGNVEFIGGRGTDPNRYLALPLDKTELWPHDQTGRVCKEALEFALNEQPALCPRCGH